MYFVANHSRHVQLIELKSLLSLQHGINVFVAAAAQACQPYCHCRSQVRLFVQLSKVHSISMHVHATIIQFDVLAFCFAQCPCPTHCASPSPSPSPIIVPLEWLPNVLLPTVRASEFTPVPKCVSTTEAGRAWPKPEVDLMRLQFANPFSQRINTSQLSKRPPPPPSPPSNRAHQGTQSEQIIFY